MVSPTIHGLFHSPKCFNKVSHIVYRGYFKGWSLTNFLSSSDLPINRAPSFNKFSPMPVNTISINIIAVNKIIAFVEELAPVVGNTVARIKFVITIKAKYITSV